MSCGVSAARRAGGGRGDEGWHGGRIDCNGYTVKPEAVPAVMSRPGNYIVPRPRFDRNELSGAFGDLGTSLPLLVGMILSAGLDPASVLVMFGLLQVATGLFYRMPMPVQPLKAVAAIVIAQRVPAEVLMAGGLAIGALMLVLTTTGLLRWIARVVPHPVIRGLQLGLGLQLALVAVRDFIPALGAAGLALAASAALIVLALLGNRRWPPAPIVVAMGILFALATHAPGELTGGIALALPRLHVPTWPHMLGGLVLLALPQVPLSIGNSILATRQLAQDLFPDREPIPVRRLGFTYALMNLVAPWMGGVPVCHGSGGMAGHYAHGGRTGGSVIIHGSLFLVTGLFFSGSFHQFVQVFPRPVLGVLLLVEGVLLARLVRDLQPRFPRELPLAAGVGVVAALVPYGYLIGMVAGAVLHRMLQPAPRTHSPA